MARPKKLTETGEEKYNIESMCVKIDEYLATETIVPILKECCLLNGWCYDRVMQLQRESPLLLQSIKKLLNWKEVKLEQGALSGQLDKTMAIFSLKQPAHAWTDKVQVENDVAITKVTELLKRIEDDTDN